MKEGASIPKQVPVLVIGAGPAGLALSRQLSRQRIDHEVLDRAAPGASWKAMPKALRLVSPWWTNVLARRDLFRHFPFSMVGSVEYSHYLAHFRARHQIRVVEDCEALAVQGLPDRSGFEVSTTRGTVTAKAVVCATGYFGRPAPPEPAYETDDSVPVVHAADYPGPEWIQENARDLPVIIVGRRVSAGQLMVELHDHGVPIALSTRSAVEFRRDGALGAIKDFIYYFYEEALISLKPRLRSPSFPVMDGGRSRQIFEAGRIAHFPPIRRIREGIVEFTDGRTVRAGVVINATGYRPALPELDPSIIHRDHDGLPACEDWESVAAPGLYFLGLDNRPNYRSRTIRGIRRDAIALAQAISRRIGATQPPAA